MSKSPLPPQSGLSKSTGRLELPEGETARNASAVLGGRASLFLLVGAVAVTAVTAIFAFPFQNWRAYVVIGVPALIALASLGSIWLSNRGNPRSGILILIATFLLGMLALPLVISGFGLVVGFSALVVTMALAAQVYPSRYINRFILLGVAVGVIAYAIDSRNLPDRVVFAKGLQNLVLGLAILAILGYLAFLLQRFTSFDLLTKLIISFVMVVLASVGVMAGFNYYITRNALTEAANRTLLASAQQTATRIDAFFQTILTGLTREARLPELRNYLSLPPDQRPGSPEEQTALNLLRSLKSTGYILRYAILDSTGTVLLDTETPLERIAELEPHLGIYLADSTYLYLALLTNQPYISPLIFPADTGAPTLFFVAPISDRAGNPAGVLVSSYHLSNIQTLVVEDNDLAGSGSFAVVLDSSGYRLAHGITPEAQFKFVTPPDEQRLLEAVAAGRLPANAATLAQSENLATQYPNFENGLKNANFDAFFSTEELGTGSELNAAAIVEIPRMKWWVVYMRPQSLVLQPIVEQAQNTIFLALIISALAMGIATLISQLITRPIVRLTEVSQGIANRAAEGNLDLTQSIEVPIQSQDEIGVLARAFGFMTDQLRLALSGLELRVAERTRELFNVSQQMTYRANQLQTVAEVARAIANVQDLDELLPLITHTISERFGFYHVGIFLIDPQGEFAVLRAANSEGGQRMLLRNHRLRVGQVGIVGYVADQGQPRVALDVGQDAVFFENPDLPNTRSEIGLPLKVGDRVTGVLDVQSTQPSAFIEEDVSLLTTLSDQVATAIQNARLFRETRQALSQIQTVQREYLRQEWGRFTTESQFLGYRYTYGDLQPLSPLEITGTDVIWPDLEQKNIVYIPAESMAAEHAAEHNAEHGADERTAEHDAERDAERSRSASRSQGAERSRSPAEPGGLYIPITLRGEVIGLINLTEGRQGQHWSDEEITLVRAVADQVGLALENARLLEESQRRAEREGLVAQITTHLRASNDPQVILQTAISELRQALRVKSAQVILPAGGHLDPGGHLDRTGRSAASERGESPDGARLSGGNSGE